MKEGVEREFFRRLENEWRRLIDFDGLFVASFLLNGILLLSNCRLQIKLADCLLTPGKGTEEKPTALTSSTTSPAPPSSSKSSSVAAEGNPRTAGEPRAPGSTGHATSVVDERTHAWPVTGQTPEPRASARAARAPGGGGGPRIFFF